MRDGGEGGGKCSTDDVIDRNKAIAGYLVIQKGEQA